MWSCQQGSQSALSVTWHCDDLLVLPVFKLMTSLSYFWFPFCLLLGRSHLDYHHGTIFRWFFFFKVMLNRGEKKAKNIFFFLNSFWDFIMYSNTGRESISSLEKNKKITREWNNFHACAIHLLKQRASRHNKALESSLCFLQRFSMGRVLDCQGLCLSLSGVGWGRSCLCFHWDGAPRKASGSC